MSSANNLHIKGLVYSSHERVQVVNNAFGGLRNRIIYEVNSRYTEHGDVIKGSFYLVTNAGEREIPYSLCVQAGCGVEMIYQEISCMLDMNIGENIFIGSYYKKQNGTVDWKRIYREAEAALAKVGLDVPGRHAHLPKAAEG